MARSAGFVLVATLWVLAGLTVLASYIDGVTTANVERAIAARHALHRELDRRNTETTLIYLLATNRKNHRALIVDNEQRFMEFIDEQMPDKGDAEIALTGQAYAGLGEIRFAIQDEAGMVPVNAPNAPQLAAMLRHVGVSAQNAVRIVARLTDYVDIDADLSLNGAERFDYTRHGLPPPPNWLMASPLELKKVLGVEGIITDDQWRRLRPVLTMRQGVGLNVSTMPPGLIAALLDTDEQAVRDIVAESATDPLDVNRLMRLAGWQATIDPEELRVLPADHLRITTWHAGGARHVAGIHLTPYVDGAAWRQDYRYTESPVDNAIDLSAPVRPAAPLLQ